MLSIVSCLQLFHISYYKQLCLYRRVFRNHEGLMQTIVTGSTNQIQKVHFSLCRKWWSCLPDVMC